MGGEAASPLVPFIPAENVSFLLMEDTAVTIESATYHLW